MLLRRAAVVLGLVAAMPAPASAIEYELFIDIRDEDDLYELWVTQQISEPTFDALLLLLQTRVDLNRADRERLYVLPNLSYADVDRILAHRDEAGGLETLTELVPVLGASLVDALAAFVVVGAEIATDGVRGFARLRSRWTGRHDRLPPALAVQGRVLAAVGLDAGLVGVLTRNQFRRARWDASRNGFQVEPESARFEVPKAYLAWRGDRWGVVLGTYRIGFGQRLTFDVTDQVTPNGFFGDYELRRSNDLALRCRLGAGERPRSPCPEDRVARVTPDYAWTNRLTGAAAGLERAPVGPGWIEGYVWGSFQVHRAPAVELVRSDACPDPRRDDDPECAAPAVYVGEPHGGRANTARYATLPAVFGEALAGGHLRYAWGPRARLGLTGYAAVPRWLVRGVALTFQESAPRPSGGRFGAAGLSASYGFGRQDLFAELTRSFDRQAGGGGGYAAIVRSVTALAGGEVDLSVRYYGSRFANPYARPPSAPDELDGLRARDEAGARLRVATRLGARTSLRALLDGWRRLSSRSIEGLVFARADLDLSAIVRAAVWAELRSRGPRLLSGIQLTVELSGRAALSCQLQHRRLPDPTRGRRSQHDLAAVLVVRGRPHDLLRLRARLRYDIEDLEDNHRLPHRVWVYAEAALALARHALRARYDLRIWLDERESTLARVPNPEHWLNLEYEARF